jgi:DNA-binding response OmpR family regulator
VIEPPRARILIVEDDAAIREGLDLNLGLEGYQTLLCADADTAEAMLRSQPLDLLLLDVMLPGRNGFELLRAVRRDLPDLPVILLTARAEEADKVLGLELGADDYITKPFGLAELRARVRTSLRRSQRIQATQQAGQPVADMHSFGDIQIDRDGHRLRRGNAEVPMTAREFSLLLHFVERPERVLTRDDLLRDVWGSEQATLRTVDNFVMRLRGKLEPDPDAPRHFVTVRGVGYRFSPTGQG